MKIYIKFIIFEFIKSFFYVFLIMCGLILILNILTEIDFFRDKIVKNYLPLYLSVLNSPNLLFEIFPFIFLLCTQIFFIKFLENNQIQIFKYFGLKNSKILSILFFTTFFLGLLIIIFFYNFSANFKNYYLEIKNKYSSDQRYLAMVTRNGLWIKEIIDNKTQIINASSIKNDFLIEAFISEFDEYNNLIRNIKSDKINIKNKIWVIETPLIYENNETVNLSKNLFKNSNFDSTLIKSLFSNLSSQTIMELIELKKNYESFKYSTIEIDLQLNKIYSYPFFLSLMTLLSTLIMFNSKNFKSYTLKITIGLFLSVLIFYLNNFFQIMGKTEKISVIVSIWCPLFILASINFLMTFRINEK